MPSAPIPLTQLLPHSLTLLVTLTLVTLRVSEGVSCDTSNAPSTHPLYKSFCGRSFIVGFSQDFAPYSWQVSERVSEGVSEGESEVDETLRYVDSVPEYATLDGWVGLDPTIMDEVAEFLGFNYTVVDVRIPGRQCVCVCVCV
jgi:hypothetical protein